MYVSSLTARGCAKEMINEQITLEELKEARNIFLSYIQILLSKRKQNNRVLPTMDSVAELSMKIILVNIMTSRVLTPTKNRIRGGELTLDENTQ